MAEESYYLANNAYTNNLDDLDLDITWPDGWNCITSSNATSCKRTGTKEEYEIKIYYNHANATYAANAPALDGKLYCASKIGDNTAKRICQAVGRNGTAHDANNYRFFL